MINNHDWQKSQIKPYFHQTSLDCIENRVDCVEQFSKKKWNVILALNAGNIKRK